MDGEPVEDRLIKRYIDKMEKKKIEDSEKSQKASPYISKRSKKLAERHALKNSFSPQSFETPEKVKRKLFSKAETPEIKTFDIEYKKKHDFLLKSLKK